MARAAHVRSAGEPIVLDTHVWLDWARGRGRWAPRVRRRVERAAAASALYVAAITPWEVGMLARAGKVRVAGPLLPWMTDALRATQTAVAPMDPAVAIDATELPAWDHGDPADRLIVATTRRCAGLLLTRDAAILEYGESTRAVRTAEPW